jgi:hypothetical protein
MPMLMLQCKTCGMIFSGGYVDEDKNKRRDSVLQLCVSSNLTYTCSRGHSNEYVAEDYMDLS